MTKAEPPVTKFNSCDKYCNFTVRMLVNNSQLPVNIASTFTKTKLGPLMLTARYHLLLLVARHRFELIDLVSQSDSDVSNVESYNDLEIQTEEDASNLFKPTSFSTPSKCNINSFNQHEKSGGEFTQEEVSFETESGDPSSVATMSLLHTTGKSQQLLSVMEISLDSSFEGVPLAEKSEKSDVTEYVHNSLSTSGKCVKFYYL